MSFCWGVQLTPVTENALLANSTTLHFLSWARNTWQSCSDFADCDHYSSKVMTLTLRDADQLRIPVIAIHFT